MMLAVRRDGAAASGMAEGRALELPLDGSLHRGKARRPSRAKDAADPHPRHAQPAQPRLPARHGGPGRDARTRRRQLLVVARGDVPLRAVDDAGRCRGGGRAALRRDAGGRLPRVGEFHYLHHDVDGRLMPTSPRWRRGSPRRQTTGIGLTLLPVFYAHSGFGGAAPNRASAVSSTISTVSQNCLNQAARRLNRYLKPSSASRRTACAP